MPCVGAAPFGGTLVLMASKPRPLLCELHAHTTWSDGALGVREVCDLYGRRGFDVLAVTDHATRIGSEVTADLYDAYLAEVEDEAERARSLYDLLVLPGLELTYDDPDPTRAAHVVAVGLRAYVDLAAESLESALAVARAQGAALVAAHPYSLDALAGATRGTAAFAARTEELAPSWTDSSSSTGTRCSTGWPTPVCRRSPRATFTS